MNAEDLLTALVAIAKDPKAWEKRIADMQKAAGDLAEARKLKADTEKLQANAQTLVDTAHYERGQAERATRDAAQQNAANQALSAELSKREGAQQQWEANFAAEKANSLANIEAREADLAAREKAVAKKLKDAETLMAGYDEAKHQAALKLAS